MSVWERVRGLKGTVLYTNAQHKAFEVVDVRDDRIVFVPQNGGGTRRWATREQIERIAETSLNTKVISLQEVHEVYPTTRNASYIAAIVTAIL